VHASLGRATASRAVESGGGTRVIPRAHGGLGGML